MSVEQVTPLILPDEFDGDELLALMAPGFFELPAETAVRVNLAVVHVGSYARAESVVAPLRVSAEVFVLDTSREVILGLDSPERRRLIAERDALIAERGTDVDIPEIRPEGGAFRGSFRKRKEKIDRNASIDDRTSRIALEDDSLRVGFIDNQGIRARVPHVFPEDIQGLRLSIRTNRPISLSSLPRR